MKKIIAFFLLLPVLGMAQSDNDTVKYEIISNNPNFTYVAGGPSLDFAFTQHNLTMLAAGVSGMFVHEKFSANLDTRFHILDRWRERDLPDLTTRSINDPKMSMDLQLLGTYYIYNDTKKSEKMINLKQSGNTIYVMKIPAMSSFRLGADLGLRTGRTWFSFDSRSVTLTDSLGNDTTAFAGSWDNNISSYFRQSVLRFGLSVSMVNDLKVNAKDYGERGGRWMHKITAHGLFGFGQQFDNVAVPNPSPWFDVPTGTYDLNPGMTYNKLGMGVGYEATQWLDKFTYAYNLELGVWPGPEAEAFERIFMEFKIKLLFGTDL